MAALELAARLQASGRRGSIVTLLCDRGERYADTVFDRGWLARHGLDIDPWREVLRSAIASGRFAPPLVDVHVPRVGARTAARAV